MKPVFLVILDGLGLSSQEEGNAAKIGSTPHLDSLFANYDWRALSADGLNVGLPEGQMGNSEVGHMNIGAGRIVYQELTRINKDIETGDFYNNKVIKEIMDKTKKNGKPLHLWGLLSDGGVHSHIEHIFALIKMARQRGLSNVYIHAVTDGRDVPPKIAYKYIDELEDFIGEIGIGKIKTVMGRYYAMDRDRRWDRTQKAYQAFKGRADYKAESAREAVEKAYEREEMDEFIQPVNIVNGHDGYVKPGDGILCFNFRPDRARQMTRVFTEKDFNEFEREYDGVDYVCFTQYDADIDAPIAYPPQELHNIAGEYMSKQGKTQFRIAETEKYAHVTFFFNGGREEPYELEDRKLIPSPKVDTYDKKPEMSAYEITEEVIKKLNEEKLYDFYLINYANPDMVGHTGDIDACIRAFESLDECLGKLFSHILDKDGIVIVTSDHGNAEMMFDKENRDIHTAHTNNPVPFILVDKDKSYELKDKEDGRLADIVPTILELLGLEKPGEMSGESLINKL